jgi:hypothetical protein
MKNIVRKNLYERAPIKVSINMLLIIYARVSIK